MGEGSYFLFNVVCDRFFVMGGYMEWDLLGLGFYSYGGGVFFMSGDRWGYKFGLVGGC